MSAEEINAGLTILRDAFQADNPSEGNAGLTIAWHAERIGG